MSHPSALVAGRVRSRLRAEGVDPSLDPEGVRLIAQSEVRRHDDWALSRGEALAVESGTIDLSNHDPVGTRGH